MSLTPQITELLRAYRASESAGRRGPLFVGVASALEKAMRTTDLTRAILLECLGVPDLWGDEKDRDLFVYYFDPDNAGANGNEWYFHLKDGQVVESGFNRRGINPLSSLRPGLELPDANAL